MKPGRLFLGVERTFAIVILVAIAGTLVYLLQHNHLPFTFFYEPDDLFADWFNPAYWAYDQGTYDTWRTLYPPLSFAFLRAVTNSECYAIRGATVDPGTGLSARECDWWSFVWLGGLFVLNLVLIYLSFRKIDRTNALPRTVCVGLGWPMLNGLERGNLILVAFTVFLLGFGPLLRSARLRWLCVGLAVNFKVYLVGALFAPLLKRRWRWSECAVLATVLVYLVSWALMGRGTPSEIVFNLQSWAAQQVGSPLDMWSATTYEALYKLLQSDIFPISAIIGSHNVETLEIVLPLLLHGTQAAILLGAAATWLRPEVVPAYRTVNFAVMIALISSEAGGYTSCMFMMLVLMERARGFGRPLAIVLCYLLALPLDYAIDQVAPVVRDTYVGHSTTIITAYVKLGPFIRPLLIQIVAVTLALVTVRDVVADIRGQGWAGRWRFRGDAPMLPGLRHPQAPVAS